MLKDVLLIFQTSIMAAEFDGGVIIGADSRTTTGYVALHRKFS